METNGKNIDDLFKDGLGDYSETPPPAAWDRLEKKLDVRTRQPNQYYRWLGYFAIISLLLLLGVSVGRNMAGDSPYTHGKIASNAAVPSTAEKIADGVQSKNGAALTSSQKDISATNIEPNAKNENEQELNTKSNDNNMSMGRPKGNIASTDRAAHHKNQVAAEKNQRKNIAYKKSKGTAPRKNNSEKEDEGPNEDAYNSSAFIKNSKNAPTPGDKEKEQPGKEIAAMPPKKDIPKLSIDNPDKNIVKKAPRPVFPRFEAGIKAGYETGFDNDAAKKAVISPYIQYNITPRFSIMLQPSVKSAYLNTRRIGTPNSYYKVNNDGKTTGPDSTIVRVPDLGGSGGFVDSLWQWRYTYSQSHDSIVKVSTISGSYLEFELPILLKYRLTRNFSVYGGVNIIYSKLISVTENTANYQNIGKIKIDTSYGGYFEPAPPPKNISSEITYNGTPISNYTGPQYPATESSLLRFGYMLGFSYEYSRRWLFDALIQQGNVSPNVQAGYNINSALSSAYLRLTIGYKLTK